MPEQPRQRPPAPDRKRRGGLVPAQRLEGRAYGRRLFGRRSRVDRCSRVIHHREYYRESGRRLIRRYGTWAVALAAFTPLPYSTISWLAGMLGVPPGKYALASLLRAPRFALYYLALHSSLEALEMLL